MCYLYTTSGNAVDALSEKIEVSMDDFAGLARIADAFLRALGQEEMVAYCLEQNGACVGTGWSKATLTGL